MGNKRLGVHRTGTEQEHLLFVDVVTVVGGAGFGEMCRQVGGAGHRDGNDRGRNADQDGGGERNMGEISLAVTLMW